MQKGNRCSGDKRELKNSLNYHWADRRNRMYLCGCFRAFRLDGEIKHPVWSKHFIRLSTGKVISTKCKRRI